MLARFDRRGFLASSAAAFLTQIAPASRASAAISTHVPLVVIDPGHGGHDPGAVGVTGLYEKHVALSVAVKLQKEIEKAGRCRAILTRNEDHFIPLRDRVRFAEQHNASLFISIHADALLDPGVRGASVYTSAVDASDKQTAALADRENSVDPNFDLGVGKVSPEVATILESLLARETSAFSAELQSTLVDALDSHVRLLNNPKRHADFAVLRSIAVPSVLMEMAFMSNKADEQLLQTEDYHDKVVSSAVQAVNRFIGKASVQR